MQAIVAVSNNWGIGKDNELLFHIRADLQRFKELTTGHTVVMGRKTLQSLPGQKGLPGRRNIVLTHNPDFTAPDVETVCNPLQAVFACGLEDFCIGGESVYRALLPACDRVYVTKVLADAEADAFFPDLDDDPRWQVEHCSEVMEENGTRFQFVEYVACEEDNSILPDSSEVSTGPTPFVPPADFTSYHGF
ncbi:MAG: dihydrofolate reductase [Clostridiales bacterium]|nr:dihydrofolate reductase [Candidatus Cacconaster stercorequi]